MENKNNRELTRSEKINLEKSLRVLLISKRISRMKYDELLKVLGMSNDGGKIYWEGIYNAEVSIILDKDDVQFFHQELNK